MKICILGLGYIGLPTAAIFAKSGYEVIGVDIKSEIVDVLNSGKVHIEEPGLDKVIDVAVKNKNFRAQTVPEMADAFIISVPTPNLNDIYKSCDLAYVKEACFSILPYLKKGNVVVIESTIAPRSMDDYIKQIFENNGFIIGEDIFLAHCPERVLPGKILEELVNNNRIVGGITEKCTAAAARLYAQFVKGEIIQTEARTAELAKCVENTYRDVNIALANELSQICYDLNINVLDVIDMANKHPRVNIHQPGPGVGGHCLAVDPYFIYSKSPENAKIIKLARDTNDSMPNFVVKICQDLIKDVRNPKIAVFGVTYKGNVDDVRESPALKVIDLLEEKNCKLAIFDPYVKDKKYVTLEEAIQNAHLLLILTDHKEFKSLDQKRIAEKMSIPQLFDTKNIVQEQYGSGLNVLNFGNISEKGRKTFKSIGVQV